MLNCATSILDDLQISYHDVLLSSGDMGFSAEKTYDIEVWYLERVNIEKYPHAVIVVLFKLEEWNARYKSNDQNKFVHTLNGSGLAVVER